MAMSKPRIIRKYANRRLYDTEASRHINKDDVRKLIAAGKEVRILEDGSGDDITRSVLLQLVAEQELQGIDVRAPPPDERSRLTLLHLDVGPLIFRVLELDLVVQLRRLEQLEPSESRSPAWILWSRTFPSLII